MKNVNNAYQEEPVRKKVSTSLKEHSRKNYVVMYKNNEKIQYLRQKQQELMCMLFL